MNRVVVVVVVAVAVVVVARIYILYHNAIIDVLFVQLVAHNYQC